MTLVLDAATDPQDVIISSVTTSMELEMLNISNATDDYSSTNSSTSNSSSSSSSSSSSGSSGGSGSSSSEELLDCRWGQQLLLMIHVGLLSLSLILEMAMAHIALKGTMWNVAPREFMEYVLYSRLRTLQRVLSTSFAQRRRLTHCAPFFCCCLLQLRFFWN